MGTQPPGSNGPCLCGSGHGLDACCATRFAAEAAAWRQSQEAERRLARSILEYALRTWGWDLFGRALRLFSTRRESPALLMAMPVFDRWFAFTWNPNPEDSDIDAPDTWPTAPLGITWLASGSARVSDYDQAFIVRAAESPYSAFQVEAVRPGWCLTIRDLMSGRRLLVVDPEISERARPDDILFSAVLTLGGVRTFLGPAPYTMPPDSRFALMDLRRAHSDVPWISRAELTEMDVAGDLCDEYTEACERGATSLLDTAGDPRKPQHLRWDVSTSFHDMLERLRPLSVCFGDEEAIDIENGPGGEPHVLMTWYQRGPSEEADDCRMTAFLYLDEGRLAADAPSRMLAGRLIAEVAARFGAAAALVGRRPSTPIRVHNRGCWVPFALK
jgi:hypothetical protein